MYKQTIAILLFFLFVSLRADPCGMVTSGPGIERMGIQRTYVFYKNKIESIVLRPGFSGKLNDFGMIIPFPSPPAIRKVEDDVFSHIAAALDPPEYRIFPSMPLERYIPSILSNLIPALSQVSEKGRSSNYINVLSEEGIGMYQVAVLEAGSAKALRNWMEQNNYKYPKGMDNTCNEYIGMKWCFVVVKARIGAKGNIDPQPGMNQAQFGLQSGQSFFGYMQGMAFRFYSEEMIVPMRLSTFNSSFSKRRVQDDGKSVENIVYALTDVAVKIDCLDSGYVVRQISGEKLLKNVTEKIPLRIMKGSLYDCRSRAYNTWKQTDIRSVNGIARKLFALDVLAAKRNTLILDKEQKEKERQKQNPEYTINDEDIVKEGLEEIHNMTMSVISGYFPRDILVQTNLRFNPYSMPEELNNQQKFNLLTDGISGYLAFGGRLYDGMVTEVLYAIWSPIYIWTLFIFAFLAFFSTHVRFTIIASCLVILYSALTLVVNFYIIPILLSAVVISIHFNKKKHGDNLSYYSSNTAAVCVASVCWLDIIVGLWMIVRNWKKYNVANCKNSEQT
ncbi:DUF2330 domain-containing protein [Candidatus Uabimicrobium sp. HlEnr_7]|uniref:DUF2330 domain-containing protein n=1 Tax=Candidatus Uabimicrobium helgolandensis TaxID=3095367 RepID=UPI0035577B7B